MSESKNKSLTLGLLNVGSLNTGQDELIVTILNESWIKPGEELLAPDLPNYKFVHKGRYGKKGGGVGFYITNGLSAKVKRHPPSSLEQMWLEVQLPGATLALGTAYRPESVNVPDTLDSLNDSVNAMARCTYTCIMGDLNIDVKMTELSNTKNFLSICHHHNLSQLVNEYTRVTDGTKSMIDVMTDSPTRCKDIKVIHNHSLSDHGMVLAVFNIKKPKPVKQVQYKRFFSNIN